VLVAGLIVKSLPLSVLRWMVVGVVIYAATMMLRSAMKRPDPLVPLGEELAPTL
jgi:type IV secretory pathway TrbD component